MQVTICCLKYRKILLRKNQLYFFPSEARTLDNNLACWMSPLANPFNGVSFCASLLLFRVNGAVFTRNGSHCGQTHKTDLRKLKKTHLVSVTNVRDFEVDVEQKLILKPNHPNSLNITNRELKRQNCGDFYFRREGYLCTLEIGTVPCILLAPINDRARDIELYSYNH